jgi:hypothetical protein
VPWSCCLLHSFILLGMLLSRLVADVQRNAFKLCGNRLRVFYEELCKFKWVEYVRVQRNWWDFTFNLFSWQVWTYKQKRFWLNIFYCYIIWVHPTFVFRIFLRNANEEILTFLKQVGYILFYYISNSLASCVTNSICSHIQEFINAFWVLLMERHRLITSW